MQTISSSPISTRAPQHAAQPFPGAQVWGRGEPPAVPTLLATRLQLELLLSGRSGSASVDLREAAGIILNDLGATLEVFRLAGEECCEGSGGVASRLEDCLASLGTEAWMDAVCAHAVERIPGGQSRLAELTVFWEHARSVAYSCWLLAEHEENICPEEAYLVGLLHEAAQLPELLGWAPAQIGSSGAFWTAPALRLLAAHWRLPVYLAELIAAPASTSRWERLLEAAHAWSGQGGAPLGCIA